MNILFLTVGRINNINERGIYTDLMRKFSVEGHKVFIVSPSERRFKKQTALSEKDGMHHLEANTLNIQKTNIVEKGLSILLLEHQYKKAIKKYWKNLKFDLVIYSTPPITLTRIILSIKKRDKAKTYLLLKDIFPQNAVDIKMLKKGGMLHKYFSNKEKKLYAASDFIGCMSQANVDYLLKHNPEINPQAVEVCPNSIEVSPTILTSQQKNKTRNKYQVPVEKTAFVYGGNLGKPQGIDFLLEVIDSNKNNSKAFFIVVGSGTEFKKTELWFHKMQPKNAILLSGLPKEEYDDLVQSCDIGLIFLDKRFTIPNYPSRLLSYLENKMPVIAATDTNTDIGTEAEENNYGFWAESGDLEKMNKHINNITGDKELMKVMGQNGYNYFIQNFTVAQSYNIIINHFKSDV